MKHFYLTATVIGAIVPYLFFIDFFADQGLNLPTFIEALFANGAAGGFTADLLITSAVFWALMLSRFRSLDSQPNPWPIVLVNLSIGLSCAFPLYLYLEDRARVPGPPATAPTG